MGMKAHAVHASLPERMAFVEKLLGDSADKHAKELRALKAAHDRHASDVSELKGGHAAHATLPERINYLERLVGDSADKHAKEVAALQEAHRKFAESHGKQVKDVEGLKALHAHHAGVAERLDYIEKFMGDSADKHFEELQALKGVHRKQSDTLDKH